MMYISLYDLDPCLNRTQISNPSVGNEESRGTVTSTHNFNMRMKIGRQVEQGIILRYRKQLTRSLKEHQRLAGGEAHIQLLLLLCNEVEQANQKCKDDSATDTY